jgi:hypothetical protein
MARGDNEKWKQQAFGGGGKVPTAGGRSRFDALERAGDKYQPPPPPPVLTPEPSPVPEPEKSYSGGGSIHIKPSHKGLLHKDLSVAAGKPIPESKIQSAKNSSDPAVRKRATFAENAKHWRH